jgi:type IV secretion system protein VirB4
LTVIAAAVSVGLIWLTISLIVEARSGAGRLFSLRPFRRQTKAVPDMLAYASLVADGVVMLKSGALLGGFYYRGRDLASSTVAERNYITGKVNQALSRLGSGWVTWQDAIRLPAPAYSAPEASHFPDEVTALIDAERRAQFLAEGAHFESEYALVFMWTPPSREYAKLAELIYDDDAPANPKPTDTLTRAIEQFNHALADVENYLGDVLRMRRMRSFTATLKGGRSVLRDDLVTYLHYCITGIIQPINVPSCPMYLDAYIGGQELFAGDTPKIGSHYIAAVSIEGFPHDTYPNMLDALDHLAIPYRWSTRMIYLDQHEALGALTKFRRKWKQKEKGFWSQVFRTSGGVVNEDAVLMRKTAEEAMADASSGLVTFGYYTPVIVLHGDSRAELDERCRVVLREIIRLGFAGRRETVNTMEAWLGSLPGHPHPNIRRPVVHTLNLADLVPLASVWPGAARNPCPFYPPNSPPLAQAATSGATPFRFNLHVGDVGHTLIFGPTGGGKSTLLSVIAAQFRRYEGATVAAFDKGRSLVPLCLAVGGDHYDIASEHDTTGFAPLQFLDTDADAAWAEEWLASLYELQSGRPPTPRQREELHRAIVLMRQSSEGRSLTDFNATVQDEDIRSALAHYTIGGQMGELLDAREDGLRASTFSVFELEDLMALGDKNVIPVLLYLFRRVEKQLTGQPSVLVLDEAWIMLGHPVFRAKVREWLKVLRKANCAVVLSTQSLSDAAHSGIFDVLVESCPTKILLPNVEADKSGTASNPGPRDLYQMMGLNETEIGLIKNATPKRHYYYTSPEGRRLFDLALGPIALAFTGVSDKDQLRRVRHLAEQYGHAWPFFWLDEKGVDYERYIGRTSKAA